MTLLRGSVEPARGHLLNRASLTHFALPVNFMVTDSRGEAARIQFVSDKPRLFI